MTLPENLPTAIRTAILWIACTAALGGWIGFVPPWTMSTRQIDEWVKAHAAATAQIEQQGRSISILQDRDGRTQGDLERLTAKVDSILRLLYTVEKRGR